VDFPSFPPCVPQDALRSLRHYADTSRARRAVLQLLAQELAPEETKELRAPWSRDEVVVGFKWLIHMMGG